MSRRTRMLAVLSCSVIPSIVALVVPAHAAASSGVTCTVSGGGTVTWSSVDWSTACDSNAPIADDDVLQVSSGTTLQVDTPVATALGGLTIDAGSTLDLDGRTLTVENGEALLDGTESSGAATLLSSSGTGTLEVRPSLSATVRLRRSALDAVNIIGTGSTALAFEVPNDATGPVTTTLDDATIDMSGSSTTDDTALTLGCDYTMSVCQPHAITGTGTASIKLAGGLTHSSPAQYHFDLPVTVQDPNPTWSMRPSAIPSGIGAATALLRFEATATKAGGGTLAIDVSTDWSFIPGGFPFSLGTKLTEIAAPDLASFKGSAAFPTDVAHTKDTSASPQLLNAVQGPILENTTAPSISGTPQPGQTLSANPGTWSVTPDSVDYQWMSRASGAPSFSTIGGATTGTLGVLGALAGSEVKVVVTAHKAGIVDGVAESATIVVVHPALTNSIAPTITGSPLVGSTLTAHDGIWLATPDTTSYQWMSRSAGASSFTAIPGATSATLAATSNLVGAAVRVDVTANRSGYVSGTASSSSVEVLSPVIRNVTAPTLIAPATSGLPVGVDVGTWSETSGVTYSYSWWRTIVSNEGATFQSFSGETGSTFTPNLAALAKRNGLRYDDFMPAGSYDIAVRVTASKPGYESATTETTYVAVTAPAPVFNVSEPAAKMAVGIATTLPVSGVPEGTVIVSRTNFANPFDYKVTECSVTRGDAACTNSGVRIVPHATGEQTVTVTLQARGGLTTTRTLKVQVREATGADVVNGTTSLTMKGGEVLGATFDTTVAARWTPNCADFATGVRVASSLVYVTTLAKSISFQCTTFTRDMSKAGDRYPNWEIAVANTGTAPGTYSVDVPYSSTFGDATFRVIVPYTVVVTRVAAQSIVQSGSMNGVTDPKALLSCPGPSDFEAGSTALYSWSSDGKTIAFGAQYRELPARLTPKSGSVTCLAIVNVLGKVTLFQAEVIIENGVRVGGSVSTYRSTTKQARGVLRSKASAQFGLRLQASGRTVVRIATYRRVAVRARARAGRATWTTRYQVAGSRYVTLKRGTTRIPITVRRAAGYRVVVTAMRRASKGSTALTPGSRMRFTLNARGQLVSER